MTIHELFLFAIELPWWTLPAGFVSLVLLGTLMGLG